MKPGIIARHWERRVNSIDAPGYDVLIAACGFESRSRHAASLLSSVGCGRRIAVGFGSRQVIAFESNRDFFAANNFELVEPDDDAFEDWWDEYLRLALASAPASRGLHLCVDISSFSRFRLAAIIEGLRALRRDLTVDFLYSPAEYSTAPRDPDVIQVCGPVTGGFAGWSGDPTRPLALVIGLGYEPGKAVGAVEYLEPKDIWLLEPRGLDPRYDRAVHRANRPLLEARSPERTIPYSVANPLETLAVLEGLAYGQLQNGRLVLVPFGPKIFALSCLLVACMHSPQTAVWRLSSGDLEQATERRAAGPLVGLSVEFIADPMGENSVASSSELQAR